MHLKFILVGLTILASCSGTGEKKIADLKDINEVPVNASPPAETKSTEIPHLPIRLADGSNISAKDLKGKVILVLFQPDCDHCQREAADFERHIQLFNQYQLYFISSASTEEVLKFAKDYKLAKYSNIHWGTTEVQNILSAYGAIQAPSVYVYSDSGKLKQEFSGEVAVETIGKVL